MSAKRHPVPADGIRFTDKKEFKMKKKYLIMSLAVALGLASCENFDNIVPAQYNKILSMQVSGEQQLSLYATGENNNYTITVMKGGYDNKATATATVDVMTDEEYSNWLEANARSYVRIPQSCFTLKDNEMQFASDDMYKVATLSIDPVKVEAFMKQTNASYQAQGLDNPTYALPITTKSSTDSVSSNANLLVLTTNEVVTPRVSFSDEISDYTITKEVALAGGEVDIPLQLQIDNIWDFDVNVTVDAANTTLSASDYELADGGKVHFAQGSNGVLKVKFNPMTHAVGTLALKIAGVEGRSFDFDSQTLKLNAHVPKYPLTTSMLSTNALEPSEGSIGNLLDGDVNTFFHSAWSVWIGQDHYVQVALNNAVTSFAFTYTNRAANGNAALYKFEVQGSADGVNYTTLRTYDVDAGDDLPLDGRGVFSSTELRPSSAVKYLRFVCHRNKTNDVFFVWSEFSLYAL